MSKPKDRIERALELLCEYDKWRMPGVVHTNSGPPFDFSCMPIAADGTGRGREEPESPGEDST